MSSRANWSGELSSRERDASPFVLQWPRFDRITLRLRRIRWAVGTNGMNSATTGFGAGQNASKNKVAGRSQKLIAAASIGTCSSWQCATGTEAARQQFTAQAIREHTGAVFTLPSRGTGLFPRDFSSKTCGTGFVLRRGRSSRCSKWP